MPQVDELYLVSYIFPHTSHSPCEIEDTQWRHEEVHGICNLCTLSINFLFKNGAKSRVFLLPSDRLVLGPSISINFEQFRCEVSWSIRFFSVDLEHMDLLINRAIKKPATFPTRVVNSKMFRPVWLGLGLVFFLLAFEE